MAISQHLDAVVIPVSDMQRAIDWYSSLLALPVQLTANGEMIYSLPLENGPQIILDAFPKGASPRGTGLRVVFSTTDIHQAHSNMPKIPMEPTSITDTGSSLAFYTEDPDGNLICIKQSKSP